MFCIIRIQIPTPIVSMGSGYCESQLVHCKSKNDDLGEHVIQPQGKYYWMLSENLWQTTLFWCNFSSKHRQTSSEVFWPDKGNWLSDRCDRNTYIWAARDDDIFLRLGSLDSYQLIYPWK